MNRLRLTLIFFYFGSLCFSAQSQDQLTKNLQEKILICGVCKDVIHALPNMKSFMENIGTSFKEYKILIYENNSVDGTKEFLNDWKNINPNILVISENHTIKELRDRACSYNRFSGNMFRTEKIAIARNKILSEIKKRKYSDFQFVLVVDMDFEHNIDIQDVLSSFSYEEDWDCITANGVRNSGHYWDLYALRTYKHPFGSECMGDSWYYRLSKDSEDHAHFYMRFENEGKLIPVYSAFAGLGIYKRDSIISSEYSGIVTKEMALWIKDFLSKNPKHPFSIRYNHKQSKIHKPQRISFDTFFQSSRVRSLSTKIYKKYIKKHFFYFDTEETKHIHFFLSSDSLGFPSCCEHVPFHVSMILQGHDKIYINPQMILRYDRNL